MKNFAYVFPKKLADVPALLSAEEGPYLLYAGGTDALARMKEGLVKPEHVVNLKALNELSGIKESKKDLIIGATTTLADLANHPAVSKYQGLSEAVKSISTVQLRNMGTVGGNLCQRPRCSYFRSRHFPCLRKKGDVCYAVNGDNKYHAILGGGPCFIVYPSDLAPMLIAMEAKVKVLGPEGDRTTPLEQFYVLPETDPYHETVLGSQELLSEVVVPKTNAKTHYLKFRERKSFDFAMVSVAVAAEAAGKKLSKVRVVMGGVAPVPWRANKAEKVLEGQTITDALLQKAGDSELADAVALDKNEYKIVLTKNLLKKAVNDILG